MNKLNELVNPLITQEYFWAFLGTFLGLFLLWIFLRFFVFSRRQKNITAFDTGNGLVTISRKAISDLIQKAADQAGGIQRCQVKLIPKRRSLKLRLKIVLRANVQLREVQSRLNYSITDTLNRTLGIDNLENIDIVVTGFSGKPEMIQEPTSQQSLPETEKTELVDIDTAIENTSDTKIEETPEDKEKS